VTTRSLLKSSVPSSKVLAVVATILSIPFLTFYWMSLIRLEPYVIGTEFTYSTYPKWLPILYSVLYLPFVFFVYTVFGNLYTYILATLASLAAVFMALARGWSHRVFRVWLLLVMSAIVAFPFLLRYQPSLVASSGYRMQWVTDPGFLGGVVKTSQDFVEKKPCEYELLGWSVDNRLYYQAECGAETQIWQYPTESGRHMQVESDLPSLNRSTVPDSTALRMVRGRFPAHGYEVDPHLLKSEGVVSPDGQWVAIVTQYVYGTQDVIVLTEAE
jgi:hypothetical protein